MTSQLRSGGKYVHNKYCKGTYDQLERLQRQYELDGLESMTYFRLVSDDGRGEVCHTKRVILTWQ